MNSKRAGRRIENADQYRTLGEMVKGSSLFIEDKRPIELNNWRRMANLIGMNVLMRYTAEDELSGKAGTRIWCKKPAMKTMLKRVLSNTPSADDEDDEL